MTEPRKPRSKILPTLVVLALAAGGYAFWTGKGSDKTKMAAPHPPAAVSVETVAPGAFPVDIEAIGSVQALNTVAIRTRVDGQIEKVLFKEGETAKQGDLLLSLDARPLQAALDQALAKKKQDEATLRNAKLDLERYTQLAKKSFATQQQLNTQQATVASGEAQLAADHAAIENAQTQLSYTQIRAPISGRIGFRQVDVGNIAHASDPSPALTIVQIDPITVVFAIPEDRIFEVQQAMKSGPLAVGVSTSDGKTELATGRLSVINNQVDVASGTVLLKATFDNAQLRLWPGQSVNVQLHVRDVADALQVSNRAVERGQDGLYVWLLGPANTVSIRKIDSPMQNAGRALVASGLGAGDRVVVEGQYRLFEGAHVTLRNGKPEGSAKEASAQ